jgi:hypothetical protein
VVIAVSSRRIAVTPPVQSRMPRRWLASSTTEKVEMRKSMIAVLAAVALGTSAVTAAIAAPHGGGGGGSGHMGGFGGGGHMGGFGGGSHLGGFGGGVGRMGGLGVGHIGDGSIARGAIGGAGIDQFSPTHSSAPHIVTSPSYGAHGQAYARRGDHDHDRGPNRGFFFGPVYYSGLYAYQPYCNTGWPHDYNYDSCYESDWND